MRSTRSCVPVPVYQISICGDPVLQELVGVELPCLIEDPQNASVRIIAVEAIAKLAAGEGGRAVSGKEALSDVYSSWISPSPVSIKMRLFCLPYAGGVSENVFGRC